MSRHNGEDVRNPNVPSHGPQLSQASGFSGLADSTLSNPDSLRLSDYPFPQPPPSLPPSPFQANFTTPVLDVPSRNHNLPLAPVRKLPPVPGSAAPAPKAGPSLPSQASSIVSPHDWHEGASSLDIDAAESRLLPTSFITSLLRQNVGPRIGRRASSNSDAISGISEITYPPIRVPSTSRTPVRHFTPEQKPHGARPPPTSYIPQREAPSKPSRRDLGSYQTTSSDTRTYVFPETSHVEKTGAPVALAVLPDKRSNELARVVGDKNTRRMNDPAPVCKRPHSVASTRTTASSILSRLSSSHKSLKRTLAKARIKPLPPVPLIPDIPIAEEIERRKAEEATPLPELLERAGALQGLLEKGYHPHRSLSSYHRLSKSRDLASSPDHRPTIHSSAIGHQPQPGVNRGREWLSRGLASRGKSFSSVRQRNLIAVSSLVLIIILVAIIVGVVVGRKHKHHSCKGGMVGFDCDLDSTCVCTSTNPLTCQGVSKSIIELLPYLNAQFMLNLSSVDVYGSLWQSSPSRSCTNQALLIDVAPALSYQSSPNRTQWARTAILWNLIESQDLNNSKQLQNFVLKAPWTEVEQSGTTAYAFMTNVSGFTFDFASQTVTSPAQSFSGVGQPSQDQDSRVNSVTRSTLDYIYGNAVASSTQHHMALTNYWQSTLQRQTAELNIFITALSRSPIILPFNASASIISDLLSKKPTTAQFPPPLACYPGLDEASINMVNAVEHDIFHLPSATSQASFSLNCYPDHPVYGVLDVLQLRLPPAGFPGQAAFLQSAVAPRAVVYNGQLLSSIPTLSNGTGLTPTQQNPRRFGTLNHFEHIIFDYLNAMDPYLANAIVDFVLNSSRNTNPVPPAQNSTLLSSSLNNIPLIEVAVFGSVKSSDIRWVESSFTLDSGSLFFGSGGGSILRQWTVAGINSTLVWAQNSTAPEVVRDKNLTDGSFNAIWNASSVAIAQKVPDAVNNLTQSLAAFGYFAP